MSFLGKLAPLPVRRRVRSVSARLGWYGRPDFLIIGAQKAGTTALNGYLNMHPQLAASAEKETFFFSPEIMRDWEGQHPFPFYERLERMFRSREPHSWALNWYHSHFPVPLPNRPKLFFESTPDYFFAPEAAARIKAYNPAMKFILLLRDPVERAYSAWNMFHHTADRNFMAWHDDRSFEEAVLEELDRLKRDPAASGTDYVRRGFYVNGMRRYLGLFRREQMLLIENRELRDHQAETLRKVCDFLGVPPFESDAEQPLLFVGKYDQEMPSAMRETLAKVYAPANKALFELLGRTYDWES